MRLDGRRVLDRLATVSPERRLDRGVRAALLRGSLLESLREPVGRRGVGCAVWSSDGASRSAFAGGSGTASSEGSIGDSFMGCRL
jgi:hypothetical protein